MPFPENGKNYDGNYLAMHWPCSAILLGHSDGRYQNIQSQKRRVALIAG